MDNHTTYHTDNHTTYHMVKTGFGRTPLYYIFIFGGKFGGKFEICRTHTSHTENLSEITKH